MNIDFPALMHADLTAQIHDVLRTKILKRDFKPGQQIVVPDVAAALNVSRTPVIDALKRLAAEGLVEIRPRVGTFVTELTAQDVAELFEVRLMIELFAADVTLAQGKVNSFLAACEGLMRAMEDAIGTETYRDYERFIANDRAFHLALVRGVENAHLLRIYENLHLHMHVARAYYLKNVEHAQHIQRQHRAIVDAFASRDAARVRETLTEHILEPKARILAILEESGGTL